VNAPENIRTDNDEEKMTGDKQKMITYITRRSSKQPRRRDERRQEPMRSMKHRADQSGAQLIIRTEASTPTAPSITSPADVAALLGTEMGALAQEQVRVLLLDTKHRVRACSLIYQGTVNSANIRVAEVVRPAVIANMPAILMVHNHPSGDPTPSPEDIYSTQRIAEAAALLDIDLVDHVILGAAGRYYSLKEDGLLRSPATLKVAA
jgi:DNA repair protein RadC